jgi:enterochelin esterase family protein
MHTLSGTIVASFEQVVADALADRLDSPGFREALERHFAPRDPAEFDLEGKHRFRMIVWHEDALVVVESERPVVMNVEDEDPVPLRPVPGTQLWIRTVRVRSGRTVNFALRVDGEPVGFGISPLSIPGYTELSHPIAEAPTGELSDERTLVSDVFGGADVPYRTYINHGIDEERGAPVMIWLDGRGVFGVADSIGLRMQTVTDNLVHRGLIPPMVHLMLSAGEGREFWPPADTYFPRRSHARIHEFDEVSARFNRHLVDEVLPDVERYVHLRADGYSRGIYGGSSGGTAAFKVGWFGPDQVSRLYPYIASFTTWGWRPEHGVDGGHLLPLWVRREPRKNLRIWMSAGYYDDFDEPLPEHLRVASDSFDTLLPQAHHAGSQQLGQFEMAAALKIAGYDFHFRYGDAGHNVAQVATELPEALTWLWRGYDPERTEETFEQDEEERAKPVYRFGVINRDTW